MISGFEWINDYRNKITDKAGFISECSENIDFIPYSTRDGKLADTGNIGWWTNGFWGAFLWQMYIMTNDDKYVQLACRAEEMMDEALIKNHIKLNHDVGFMWLIQSGVHYAWDKNSFSYSRALLAADKLMSRYNPNGFLRAWNSKGSEGWSIIDSMMNLPLLYWASRQTGDPRYELVAKRHADSTMRTFIRNDGSVNHIVCYDPRKGNVIDILAGQGFAPDSSWSRGQSWALYGFLLSYLETDEKKYLEVSEKVADYCCENLEQYDWLAPSDFRQPAEPVVWDDTASSILASAFLELADNVTPDRAEKYRNAACRILKRLLSEHTDWTDNSQAILQKCTTAYHDLAGRHITMNYADYFLIETINKIYGIRYLFWEPDRKPWPDPAMNFK